MPDGFWPASYDRAYLFGDFICNKIFKLTPRAGGGFTRELFAGRLGPGGPIAMEFGPYRTSGRALYYTTFRGEDQVRRIVPTGGNRAPGGETVENDYKLLATKYAGFLRRI